MFDLDAAVAERPDEEPVPFEFEWGGVAFTLPHPMDADLRVPKAVASGDYAETMRLLLGDAEWERFTQVAPATPRAFMKLSEAWQAHYQAGESSASASS